MSYLNINIGVMGHVDSGKTSLCKSLSEIASTAAFDKNPQSQERGITIDLGFSCFRSPIPDHLKNSGFQTLQITLVDCPGHASLFKTVIGGSKIIDAILLIIDVSHGIQIQTAECIILAEILQKPVLVALNKVDLLKNGNIDKEITKISKIIARTLIGEVDVIPVSIFDSESVFNLKNQILKFVKFPERSDGDLLICVDHCFSIKGKGTIMTGTVIQGALKVNDEILIIEHNEIKEVKSIQVFKKPVESISQGDRAGISITRFNAKLIERSLICSPKSPYKYFSTIILKPILIQHYKTPIKSNSKVLISVGYEVVSAQIIFYEKLTNSYLEECLFVDSIEYGKNHENVLCLMKTDNPFVHIDNSIVIGLNLSADPKKKSCRLIFHGKCMPRSYCVILFII